MAPFLPMTLGIFEDVMYVISPSFILPNPGPLIDINGSLVLSNESIFATKQSPFLNCDCIESFDEENPLPNTAEPVNIPKNHEFISTSHANPFISTTFPITTSSVLGIYVPFNGITFTPLYAISAIPIFVLIILFPSFITLAIGL